MRVPRLVVAGTNSGVGKTSLTLSLVCALRRRGLRVQTFKVGPDYLDPTYLQIASGRPCYNLDLWMTGRDYVRGLLARAAAGGPTAPPADICIVEGVMGLFDGARSTSSEGSTADVASLIQAPVVLVVNAHGTARSLCAVIQGFREFEQPRGPLVQGILLNRCGSESHKALLADALGSAGLSDALLGAFARDGLPDLPSRHLGLVTADEEILREEHLEALADACERSVDV
ncbi:MAG: cobyrinic acid a,c-diamide synthase, partial [Deltaproteobacteria bacterium]|nr:cobyrinic acid a,c-diamide synthase [Deltaproteobacteria bacterium]